VQVNVASAAVVGGKMKDRVDSLHRGARNARIAQIGANELDFPGSDMPGNVSEVPARQIIDNANLSATLNQLVRKG
jgi:hypothetical protein